jgi:hypothetical protein
VRRQQRAAARQIADYDLCARVLRLRDQLQDARGVRLREQRREHDVRVRRADAHGRREARELGEEGRRGGALDDRALGRHADLARVRHRAEE